MIIEIKNIPTGVSIKSIDFKIEFNDADDTGIKQNTVTVQAPEEPVKMTTDDNIPDRPAMDIPEEMMDGTF